MKHFRRSIRTKIMALLAVPLVGLVGLWVFATVLTAGPVISLLDSQTRFQAGTLPALDLVAELQAERRAVATHLGTPNQGALGLQFASTDAALAEFRSRTGDRGFRRAASGAARERLGILDARLSDLLDARPAVEVRQRDRAEAMTAYTETVEAVHQFQSALTVDGDARLALEGRAMVELSRGRELVAQIDAVVVGAREADALAPHEPQLLVQLIGARRAQFRSVAAELPPAVQADFAELVAGNTFEALRGLEDQLLAEAEAGQPVPVDLALWRIYQVRVADLLSEFEVATTQAVTDRASAIAQRTIGLTLLAGVLGLVIVVSSLVASMRLGRSVIERLTSLRGAARELAEHRLPDVVARLRRAEVVDVAAATPELRYGRDEIGDVGRAFNQVQRTAVAAAVDEARLRHGLNEVFLNIARRSQTLVHRQLELIDRLERRAEGPEELAQLFKLDHMTTRMRRHAENLVILAGGSSGRGRRGPVRLADVIRGAISEIEEYARVTEASTPDIAIEGHAAGDVIHLLAELIENATAYSPPYTEVDVRAQLVPRGAVIEVDDRGLGMTAEALATANRTLAAPPQFDPADSQRLGLRVVAQIATRLGIGVTLRPSAYRGVTAVVLVPVELLAEAPPVLPPSPAAPPAPSEAPPGAAPAPRPEPDGSADDELPQRTHTRRRAAPKEPSAPAPAGEPVTGAAPRTPEEVRARMSAYQRDLARGRAEADAGERTAAASAGEEYGDATDRP